MAEVVTGGAEMIRKSLAVQRIRAPATGKTSCIQSLAKPASPPGVLGNFLSPCQASALNLASENQLV